jgi:hypothetical protein
VLTRFFIEIYRGHDIFSKAEYHIQTGIYASA